MNWSKSNPTYLNSTRVNERVQSIYSWDKYSETQVSKHIDKSVIRYDGSAIPLKLYDFFDIQSLTEGGKCPITLIYEGKAYSGIIVIATHNNKRRNSFARIFWRKDLGDQIRFFCKKSNGNAEIFFLKSASSKNQYYVNLLTSLPESVDNSLNYPVTLTTGFAEPNDLIQNVSIQAKSRTKTALEVQNILDNNRSVEVQTTLELDVFHRIAKNESHSHQKWMKLSETIVCLKIDKTIRTYRVTTLPKHYLEFFEVENQKYGDDKEVVVIIRGHRLSGLISRIDPHNERTRLSFRRQETLRLFDDLIGFASDNSYLFIEKITDASDTYQVSVGVLTNPLESKLTSLPSSRHQYLGGKMDDDTMKRPLMGDFISALGKHVIEITSSGIPIELATTNPLPPKLRIYLFELKSPSVSSRDPNFKIRATIKNQKNEQSLELNNSDDAFLIFAGYNPELKVFVLWDAYMHLKLNQKYHYMSICPELIYDTLVSGFKCEMIKKRGKKPEIIISVLPHNLITAIERRYYEYVNDLINGVESY